jgi:hypothetical protein
MLNRVTLGSIIEFDNLGGYHLFCVIRVHAIANQDACRTVINADARKTQEADRNRLHKRAR